MDLGTDTLAHNHPINILGIRKTKGVRMNVVVLTENRCRHIQRTQIAIHDLAVGQLLIALRRRVLFGIGTVNGIDILGHQDHVCPDLRRTKRRRRIR